MRLKEAFTRWRLPQKGCRAAGEQGGYQQKGSERSDFQRLFSIRHLAVLNLSLWNPVPLASHPSQSLLLS